MKKDAGLRIRIDRDLREKFLQICREQDRPAAQVIREFMRAYVRERKSANESVQELNVSNQLNSGDGVAE